MCLQARHQDIHILLENSVWDSDLGCAAKAYRFLPAYSGGAVLICLACTPIHHHTLNLSVLQVLDAQNLQPVHDVTAQPTLLAVAAHFLARDGGLVRLIDNCIL